MVWGSTSMWLMRPATVQAEPQPRCSRWPSKMQALEKEGIRIVERVPMVPRSWQRRQHSKLGEDLAYVHVHEEDERGKGATMIGAGEVYGEDLDKYLRTKVLRMGHMLPLLSDLSDA